MQKKLLGLLEPQAAKCQKFLCIGSEAQEFFCIGSEIAPSWHLSDLMQKNFWGSSSGPNTLTKNFRPYAKNLRQNCTFRALAKVFY